MMNGKITRSLSGSTGRTSGILIASSFAVSFASVISTSQEKRENMRRLRCNGCSRLDSQLLQSVQLLDECIDVLEAAIHRREADVGNGIEVAQPIHDQGAEGLRRNLAFGGVGHRRLDRVGDPLQYRLRDGAFATGDLQPAHQLIAVVRLAPLIALDDLEGRQLDLFVTREPALAAGALAAPSDDVALASLTRVHYPVF